MVLGIYMSLLTHIKILFVEVYTRVPAKEVGLYEIQFQQVYLNISDSDFE